MRREFQGLIDQGVFSTGHTLEDIRAKGIRGKPVPCKTALTYKFKDGWLDKLKARICIAGHRGNMTKGIHYHDVFAAAPVEHTERILQAMLVIFHLQRCSWDIVLAYTWAPLPEGQKIAVEYPEGFKPDPLPPKVPGGEPQQLYLILEANLYGVPSAGRGWSITRNRFVEKRFNPGSGYADSGTWKCTRCLADPCLYVIDKIVDPNSRKAPRDPRHSDVSDDQRVSLGLPDNIERSWVLVHTDDCDGYGTSIDVLNEIKLIMHEEWEVKDVDPSYILGLKRTLCTDDPEHWIVTVTMEAYVDQMVSTWEHELVSLMGSKWQNRVLRTHWPDGLILTKALAPDVKESTHNLNRGYQKLVGSLLWAVRHCFPDCLYGMSQLCKLMGCPTDLAFKSGIRMLLYMYPRRHDGIRFSETNAPIKAYVDASNNPDPYDCKCQYGFAVQWGGPIITKSSKLDHVGMNSTYNEYMALTHAIKHLVWLRKLLCEMGLSHVCQQAIPVLADNAQANNLCKEDLVTKGNMYFNVAYHYNKEQVKAGEVNVIYVASDANTSDILTKATGPVKEQAMRPAILGYDARSYLAPVNNLGNRWNS